MIWGAEGHPFAGCDPDRRQAIYGYGFASRLGVTPLTNYKPHGRTLYAISDFAKLPTLIAGRDDGTARRRRRRTTKESFVVAIGCAKNVVDNAPQLCPASPPATTGERDRRKTARKPRQGSMTPARLDRDTAPTATRYVQTRIRGLGSHSGRKI